MESSETTVNSENMAGNSEAKIRIAQYLSAANHTPNIDALKVSQKPMWVILEVWPCD